MMVFMTTRGSGSNRIIIGAFTPLCCWSYSGPNVSGTPCTQMPLTETQGVLDMHFVGNFVLYLTLNYLLSTRGSTTTKRRVF